MSEKPWEIEGVSKATWYRRKKDPVIVEVAKDGALSICWEDDPRTKALRSEVVSLRSGADLQSGTKLAEALRALERANAEIEVANTEIARLKKELATVRVDTRSRAVVSEPVVGGDGTVAKLEGVAHWSERVKAQPGSLLKGGKK